MIEVAQARAPERNGRVKADRMPGQHSLHVRLDDREGVGRDDREVALRPSLPGLVLGLAAFAGGPALAADQNAAPTPIASQPSPLGAIAVSGPSGAERVMTPEDIAALPAVQVTVAVEPGHGPPQRTYEGPLLWTLLDHAGAVHADKFREHVHQAIIATGSDGYSVVVAAGEISPEFGAKQVIVADRVDGQALEAGHFRLVVPGEKRGGRSARDLVRIRVTEPRSD